MEIPEQVVVIHLNEDGGHEVRVWGDQRVCVLWIDEGCKRDRVFCQTSREGDPEELRALIGSDTIGHAGDGVVTPEMEQAVRAMAWKLEGGKLAPIAAE